MNSIPSGEELRIVGRTNLNRSLEGDVVAVEITSADRSGPESGNSASTSHSPEGAPEVSAELQEVNEEAEAFADEADDAEDVAPEPESAQSSGTLREARVVGIIRRGRREFCGTLKPIDKLKGTAAAA